MYQVFIEVQALLVDQNNRCKGIGEKLLLAIEESARLKGFSEVKLNSRIDRKRAHNFYVKMGYRCY